MECARSDAPSAKYWGFRDEIVKLPDWHYLRNMNTQAPLNHQFLLAGRPEGLPGPEHFTWQASSISPLKEGEVLVKNLFISIDPAMRGWMNALRSYIRPVEIGEVMRAGTVGKVVESQHPGFHAEDYVQGNGGVQEYAISSGDHLVKVNPDLAPLPVYLSTLGMTGLTAYFGLLDVAKPQSGETVVVSAAAGAVGSIVGQIAKIKGCKVIGIAGGQDKCDYVMDVLGFDAVIDYKSTTESLRSGLMRACPEGVDVYFDNVGGPMLDTVLTRLRHRARVVICGAISQYNQRKYYGPSNYMSLLVNRARMEGFVVFDYKDQYQQAIQDMALWRNEGKLHSREEVHKGLSNFPEALLRLFNGEKIGKLVLQV